MMVPRFPYIFPQKGVDAKSPMIIKDQNRCIMCKRCIKSIKDEDGRSYFAFNKRGHELEVILDPEMGQTITRELAEEAMEVCPVGSIICKEIGYAEPIGKRKYDKNPIGSEIEV
jgi:[NiFe] hydrogenase diaphorase moiety small subunit